MFCTSLVGVEKRKKINQNEGKTTTDMYDVSPHKTQGYNVPIHGTTINLVA
jgi:hypothetical protein